MNKITNSAIIMVETSGNRTTLTVPVAASHLPAKIILETPFSG